MQIDLSVQNVTKAFKDFVAVDNVSFEGDIGGIDPTNAGELANVGRAAVSSAILGAPDPEEAARLLRRSLG